MTLEAPFSRFLWFRSNWGLPVLASEEGWGVVWWENSCHIKTCGLGGFSSTSHVDNTGLGKCVLADCHMNAGADSKRQCWHCDWETGGKHQRNPGSVFLGFKSRIPWPRLPWSQTETGIPNDLFAGQDWDKDQLQRWAWDGRVQGGCHQVGWNWIGSFIPISLWKPWQPRIFLLGNLVNAQTYHRGSPDGAQMAEILIHQTIAQQPRFR